MQALCLLFTPADVGALILLCSLQLLKSFSVGAHESSTYLILFLRRCEEKGGGWMNGSISGLPQSFQNFFDLWQQNSILSFVLCIKRVCVSVLVCLCVLIEEPVFLSSEDPTVFQYFLILVDFIHNGCFQIRLHFEVLRLKNLWSGRAYKNQHQLLSSLLMAKQQITATQGKKGSLGESFLEYSK